MGRGRLIKFGSKLGTFCTLDFFAEKLRFYLDKPEMKLQVPVNWSTKHEPTKL